MLTEEIERATRLVRTDAYQMSVGEIISMYDNDELFINPDFQRLFRWNISQKSKLIESLLLGIPLPPIFVFEKDNGSWELIDGLQRISTILEFVGRLRDANGDILSPSVLEATKYLRSLHNAVWQTSDAITEVAIADQRPFDRSHQLTIRRCRLGVEILKRPSDEKTKFDLFQRLNAGGTQANAQELRNCIVIMIDRKYFGALKSAAERDCFKEVIAVSEDQLEKQRHLELATRFLVHLNIDYDGELDVEEYIDDGIVQIAKAGNYKQCEEQIVNTFGFLREIEGDRALRRFNGTEFIGKVGLVGLEGVAVGIAKNYMRIMDLGPERAKQFAREKIRSFWLSADSASFTLPGMRGTTRIKRTIPFGERWFRP